MAEVSTESIESLTEEQKEFLRQCETDFVDRFTDSDPEYIKVRDREKMLPPIEDPWWPFRDRDRGRRHDNQQRDRNGWHQYRRYHTNYRRRDNYNHYRREPYQSNHYRN